MLKRTLPLLVLLTGVVFAAYSLRKPPSPAPAIAVQPVTALAPALSTMLVSVNATVTLSPLKYDVTDMSMSRAPVWKRVPMNWRKGLTPLENSQGQRIGVKRVGQYCPDSSLSGGKRPRILREEDYIAIHHGFLYAKRAEQDLGALGGHNSSAACINEGGQIVGEADSADDSPRPVLWEGRKPTPLPTMPIYITGKATWINNHGDIVGSMGGTFGSACLWRDGQLYILDTQSGLNGETASVDSVANCISDSGDIVGDKGWHGAIRRQAFYCHEGKMQWLTPLSGYTESYASGVNSRGEAVGRVERQVDVSNQHWKVQHSSGGAWPNGYKEIDHETQQCAVLWRNGACINLNTLLPAGFNWELRNAKALNNEGCILAEGYFLDKIHTFLLKPRFEKTLSRTNEGSVNK